MEVSREELENLIAEALMRDGTFRPKRRNWNEISSEESRRARVLAAAIATFLYAYGVRWTKLPAAPPHRTPAK